MSILPAHRTTLALTLAIWVGVVVALGAARVTQYFNTPQLEYGDIAVNAMQIENAKYFKELYGNYSRFEFNHPGPAFFYVYAAGEWILSDGLGLVPSPGNAHLVAALFLQSLFFAGALALFSVHLPATRWLPFALLAAALFFGFVGDAFVSIWPPHVLLMPFLCFLVACTSVAAGRHDHLPWVVVSGGFLFHGHVAQPLFVGGLGGLALATVWWRERQPGTWRLGATFIGTHRRVRWISAALAAMFLLPLLIDLLTKGTRGNVATILGTFSANSSDKPSLLQSLLYFLSFGSSTREQDALFTELGPQSWAFFAERRGLYLTLATLFCVPLGLLFRWPHRFAHDEHRFLRTCYAFLGATVLLCLFWGRSQAGGMHHFNGFFYYAIYFFGLLLGLAILTRLIDRVLPPPLATALICCAAILATWVFRTPRFSEEESGLALRQGIEAALAADPAPGPKLLRFEHHVWPAAASVALDLKRRGIGVYMTPWWTFMFGSRHEETRLGPAPETTGSVWWVTVSETGNGHPLTNEVSLFTQPGAIDPSGTRLRFSRSANGFRYLVSGLTVGNLDAAWTDLPRLTFKFKPLPAPGDVRIEWDAQSNVQAKGEVREQTADVLFNGVLLGQPSVITRTTVSVVVPQTLWNTTEDAVLELRFPEAQPFRTPKRPGYQNWRAWGIWEVGFEVDR
jgi:hypothetical protein